MWCLNTNIVFFCPTLEKKGLLKNLPLLAQYADKSKTQIQCIF